MLLINTQGQDLGVPSSEVDDIESGMVHIYQKDFFGWTKQTSLISPNAKPLGKFGHAVAMQDDWLLLAARGERKVYFYVRPPDLGDYLLLPNSKIISKFVPGKIVLVSFNSLHRFSIA